MALDLRKMAIDLICSKIDNFLGSVESPIDKLNAYSKGATG